MSNVKHLSNLIDLRLWLKGKKIKEGKCSVEPVVLNSIDVVEKDTDKSILTFKDIKSDNEKLPKIKTNVRMDVFNFFNKEMTEYINRRLRNLVCDYAIDNGVITGAAPSIENYMSEYDELMDMARSKSSYLESTIATISVENMADDFKMSHDSSLLTLSFGTKVDAIYVEHLPVPKHNNLRYKRAVLLGTQFNVCDDLVLLAANKTTNVATHVVDKELIVVTDHGFYIIDRTINKNLSMRKLAIDEFNR